MLLEKRLCQQSKARIDKVIGKFQQIMNPMEWFFWKPERIFAVSCVFLLGYFIIRLFGRRLSSVRSWPLLVPTIAWVLFAIWESFCRAQQFNIRVDLFLIYPVLIIVSIFGLSVSIGSLISNLFKKQPSSFIWKFCTALNASSYFMPHKPLS